MIAAASVNLISEVVIWQQEAERTDGIADILRSYTRKVYHTGSTEWIGSGQMESTAKAILDAAVGCANLGSVSGNRPGLMNGSLQNTIMILLTLRTAGTKTQAGQQKKCKGRARESVCNGSRALFACWHYPTTLPKILKSLLSSISIGSYFLFREISWIRSPISIYFLQ